MASNSILIDGRYKSGFYAGAPEVSFPFEVTGDTSTVVVTRQFRSHISTYAPGKLGADMDPQYAGARLVASSPPQPALIPEILAVTRTFATLPPNQIVYDQDDLTKPTAGAAGGTVNTSPYVNVYFYDSINTSVQIGLPTYYRDYMFINNEVYGSIRVSTSATSGGNTRVTQASHGIAGTERITAGSLNVTGAWYTFDPGEYTVVDPDTIDLLGVNYSVNIIRLARKLRDYTPGSNKASFRTTQEFYLKGVSPGITTDADIPLITDLRNDAAFIDAVLANLTGWVDYSATGLGRWPSDQSPIRTRTVTAINFATL